MATAQPSTAIRSLPPSVNWRQLASLAAGTALTLFVVLAALVAVRRLSGAMTQPLPGPILLPLGAGLSAVAVLLRLWLLPANLSELRSSRPVTWTKVIHWWLVALPSLALAVLLVSVMTPGTSLPAALAGLMIAAIIDGLFWRHIGVALRAGPERRERLPQPVLPIVAEEQADSGVEDEAYPAELLQQIVRTRGAGGGETIHAVLRAAFQPGEQTHVMHVAFCPPLDRAPKLEAVVAGEDAADVKVTAAYTFGARLEVYLALPAVETIGLIVELRGDSTGPT